MTGELLHPAVALTGKVRCESDRRGGFGVSGRRRRLPRERGWATTTRALQITGHFTQRPLRGLARQAMNEVDHERPGNAFAALRSALGAS